MLRIFCAQPTPCCDCENNTIRNMSLIKTNLKLRRAIYHRWSQIHGRCYNDKQRDFRYYGAKGMTVARIWHRTNPDGFDNFMDWYMAALKEQTDPQVRNICLREGKKEYSPENCILKSQLQVVQDNPAAILTAELVLALRRLKREQPHLTARQLRATVKLNISEMAIRNAVCGDSFSNLNHIEAPIPRRVKEAA